MRPSSRVLKSEPSAEEKKIAQLEQRVRQLEKTEPNASLRCFDQNGACLDAEAALELNVTHWLPLTEDQIASMMSRIKSRFPMKTNFEGSSPVSISNFIGGLGGLGLSSEYVPPKEDDIKAYREDQYPAWLDECASRLRAFHNSMQVRELVPICTILRRNDGSRPAEDVLVSIEANGSFHILRAKQVKTKRKKRRLSFPPSPKAPEGKYVVHSIADLLDSALPDLNLLNQFSSVIDRYPYADLNVGPLLNPGPFNRDRNTFYSVKGGENKRLEWDCDQWRHGEDNYQPFEIGIVSKPGDSVNGLLDCKIQAANISTAAVCKVPIRIKPQEVSAFARANELVDKFVAEVILRRVHGDLGAIKSKLGI